MSGCIGSSVSNFYGIREGFNCISLRDLVAYIKYIGVTLLCPTAASCHTFNFFSPHTPLSENSATILWHSYCRTLCFREAVCIGQEEPWIGTVAAQVLAQLLHLLSSHPAHSESLICLTRLNGGCWNEFSNLVFRDRVQLLIINETSVCLENKWPVNQNDYILLSNLFSHNWFPAHLPCGATKFGSALDTRNRFTVLLQLVVFKSRHFGSFKIGLLDCIGPVKEILISDQFRVKKASVTKVTPAALPSPHPVAFCSLSAPIALPLLCPHQSLSPPFLPFSTPSLPPWNPLQSLSFTALQLLLPLLHWAPSLPAVCLFSHTEGELLF